MKKYFISSDVICGIHYSVVWALEKEPLLIGILISQDTLQGDCFPDAVPSLNIPSLIKRKKNEIADFIKGRNFFPSTNNIFLENMTPFQLKVLKVLRDKVPPGKVITYGRLAEISGHKNASRAVGSVMKSNKFPLIFPCHRVVKSDRSLGNFGGGIKMKKYLLENEGVKFEGDKIGQHFFI